MSDRPSNQASLLLAAAIATVAFILGWSLYRQGIDLGSDGAWLLGSARLLDGGRLYHDFEPGDGPLRYWILAPFLAAGAKAASLAFLRSLGFGLFASAGFFWLRRRSTAAAWGWPLALLALGPLDVAVALGLLTLAVAAGRWRFSAPAIGALLVAAACVDTRTAIAVGLLAGAAHFARSPEERGGVRQVLAGAAAMALLATAALALSGDFAVGLRNAFVDPASRLIDHFQTGGGLRWWNTLHHGAWVQLPFAELRTGEVLSDLGPLHRFAHRWSYRSLVLAIAVGAGALLALHRDRRRLALAAGGIAAAAWWLLSSGDTPSIEGAGLLLIATSLLAQPPGGGRRSRRWTRGTLLALVFVLPLGLENFGLATRVARPELEKFERGGIFLARERASRLEEFFARIGPALSRPIVIWPDQAGLYFLYKAEPAVGELGLVGLHLPRERWRDDLLAADPEVILLAQNWNSTAQAFRQADEELWAAMQEHYRVAGWLRGRTDKLRLLVHMQEGESLDTLPLTQRLPQTELTVSNDSSPALRRNLTIGQSFRTGDRDLAGVLVKWKTAGTNLGFDCKIRVWEKLSDEFDTLLSSTVVHLEVPGDGARTFVRLDVPQTAHMQLAVTFELLDDLPREVRLQWHRHDASGQDVDLYEDGDALLDLHETDADLYFVAY